METPAPEILKTKAHFDILDGLRGIAAISVVTFHFMEVAISDYSKNFIGHGFLAVDFFFCLSGFVIAYAYDGRIGKMGVWEFFKSRLIRLHPLVVLGSVIGLLSFFFGPFGTHTEVYGAGKITLIFLTSILLIPFPVMSDRAFNLFGINAPSWSLFWEYVANIVYAFILYRLPRRWLWLLTIIAAISLCLVCYRAGNLMGGWSGGTFWDGGARIAFSFSAGVLVYRSGWIIRNKLGFIGLAILLVLAFIMPFSKWNFTTEPVVVIIYFPLIIALGAGATLNPAVRKLCVFSGKISYPLYMTHYAFIWIFADYLAKYKPGTTQLAFVVVAGTIGLILFGWLMMTIYDIPVRKYLARKRSAPVNI